MDDGEWLMKGAADAIRDPMNAPLASMGAEATDRMRTAGRKRQCANAEADEAVREASASDRMKAEALAMGEIGFRNTKMPKHLFSGKLSADTRDRR
ncbi:hypothetical protein BY458DRAFT_560529 [Sporodiniella umbellata]|nr:hypothetical protein BY458DRAFT_560529 [Sporodiniella umbellata]